MSYGTVHVGRHELAITHLRLIEGALEVTSRGVGPMELPTPAPADLYGDDGRFVCRIPDLRLSEDDRELVRDAATVTIVTPITLTMMLPAAPEEVADAGA